MQKTKIEIKNKDFLYQKYIVEKMTGSEIAKLTNIPKRTIYSWLIKFRIPRRKRGVEHWSEEQKEYRRQWNKNHLEINRMKGKKHSKETKLKMSLSRQKEKNANWKGDKAREKSGRERARRWFVDKRPCENCGKKEEEIWRLERHHKDGNPLNNKPENIQWLCYLCHKKIHKKEKLQCSAHA